MNSDSGDFLKPHGVTSTKPAMLVVPLGSVERRGVRGVTVRLAGISMAFV